MEAERAYLDELVRRLQGLLGPELVGVYAGGSWALGGYEPGPSDLDVAVVVRKPLTGEAAERIVAELRHEAFPCPARGLELVVYTEGTVGTPTIAPGFELNLNAGSGLTFRADREPRPASGTGSPSTGACFSNTGSRSSARRPPTSSRRSRPLT